MKTDTDTDFLKQALKLGLGQMGRTWPNPAVGCVIVRDGEIVGEGATGDGGRPHAEEVALDRAGGRARGATAYVTLEPCGQRSGGGCSCSQRLIDAGVGRVVYACADPSPYASHQGPQRMKDAGIAVEFGLLVDEAEPLIAPFAYFLKTGRPMVRPSQTSEGFDAEFIAADDADLSRTLTEWAQRGYRHLRVVPGSSLVDRLRDLGHLTP